MVTPNTQEEFLRLLRQEFTRGRGFNPLAIPGTVVGEVRQNLEDFGALVGAAIELFRGQTPALVPTALRLEGISHDAGRLLFDAGVVTSVDEGIVVFHERITRDKPSLRKLLLASDRRVGRLARVKTSRAQRAARLALKAGLVTRSKNGQIKAFSRQAKLLIKRAKRKEQIAREKKKRARQKTALAKLKGIGGS